MRGACIQKDYISTRLGPEEGPEESPRRCTEYSLATRPHRGQRGRAGLDRGAQVAKQKGEIVVPKGSPLIPRVKPPLIGPVRTPPQGGRLGLVTTADRHDISRWSAAE